MDRIVLLKMSGEAVADIEGESIVSAERLDYFTAQIAIARKAEPDLKVAVMVGGGNIIRGKMLPGVNRTKADHMGMLATIINALALQDAMTRAGLDSRVMSGMEAPMVAESYIYGRAMRHLAKNRVIIFAGGLGSPFFTTDTAAALRATEIGAQVLLLAKFGTDGVYSKDPRRFADAVKFETIDYDSVMSQNLQVMDATAVALCRDNSMPIFVFDVSAENAVSEALLGRTDAGTLICFSTADGQVLGNDQPMRE
ncbi:UMP kinase [Micromonospora sp. FIMYZ51]|uniref:UMP kinase n=1 Tax=Micromonospora sp. FIMYZ51 TaxID=3051832 RepID=UPI00311E6798